MGGRSAVAAALMVWLGLAAGGAMGTHAVAAVLIAIIPFAWLARRAPERVGTVALLLALGLAGLARGGAARAAMDHGPHRLDARIGEHAPPQWIRAELVAHPLRETPDPLAIVRLVDDAFPLPSGTRLRLRLPAACDAEWGDTVTALATLERPNGLRNPGGFNARDAARGDAVAVQGRALVARVARARGVTLLLRATAARWRRAVEAALGQCLSPASRELVTPLVVGDRSAFPPELGAEFRAAGLTHLLALSGMHVVWLASVARAIAAALGAGVRGRALCGAACALFYAAIAGPLPSLMRAVATELAAATARLLGRAVDPVQALAVSVLVLLCIAPGWAGDLGFQLSCAATLGMVTIGPFLTERSGRARWLAAPFIPTVAAQIVALPLLLDRFHTLPWLSLMTNLMAVPISGLLLAAAWAGAAIESALPGTAAPWFAACEVLAAVLRGIAHAASRVPGARLGTGSEPGLPWLAAGGAALVVAACMGRRALDARAAGPSPRRCTVAWLGTLGVVMAIVLPLTARPLAPPPGCWWLVALDAGQGDALALGFADGWWLVDTGPRSPHADAGEMAVLPFLRWAGIRRIERMVLTHDDGDHTGGAPAVLRGVHVERILTSPALPDVPGPAVRFAGTGRVQTCVRGDTLHEGPRIVVRWPPAGLAVRADNAASLVLEVGEGAGRALLLADVDSTREDSLRVMPGIAVLKVAHHGSASSSGAEFLARVHPHRALLTVGRRNPFGHPDPRALARLGAAGAAIRRTDRDGAVWLECSAAGVRDVNWRRERPRDARSALPSPVVAPPGPRW